MQTELSAGRIRVDWNPSNLKEIDEAKKKYLEARKQFRDVLSQNGNPIERFDPYSGSFVIGEVSLKEHEFAVRLVNETGDERLIWNVNDPLQVKEAAERFQKYLDKGWKAYSIRVDGTRGPRIYGFDAKSEEVIFDDKTTRSRLKDFARAFRKVEILPRTFPG